MRKETFDPRHDKSAICAHCGHEYLHHFCKVVDFTVAGNHRWDPCGCRYHDCHCERFSPRDGEPRPHDGDRKRIVDRILAERNRHDADYGKDVHHSPGRWLSASMEELGEVARALHDGDLKNLPVELTQLCALCLAWLEDIERFGTAPMDRIAREVHRG